MAKRIAWTILVAVFSLAAADFLLYHSASGDDLYPRWYGAQQLLLHGYNPYGPRITQEIEQHIYGRVPSADEIRRHRDQHRFAYPVYVAFLLTPLIWTRFAVTLHIVWLLLALATFLSIQLWIEAMGWDCPHWIRLTLSVVTLFSPVSQRGLAFTQLALLVAFLCACVVWSLVKGHWASAGIILAIATIKPQMVIVLTAWLIMWAASRLRERKQFLIAFCVALSALIAAGLAFAPRWIPDFRTGLTAYRNYTGAPSALGAVLGKNIAPFIAIPVCCALAFLMWNARHDSLSSLRFRFTTAACLVVTAWAVPTMWDSYNQVLVLPAVFLAGAFTHQRRQQEKETPSKPDDGRIDLAPQRPLEDRERSDVA